MGDGRAPGDKNRTGNQVRVPRESDGCESVYDSRHEAEERVLSETSRRASVATVKIAAGAVGGHDFDNVSQQKQ